MYVCVYTIKLFSNVICMQWEYVLRNILVLSIKNKCEKIKKYELCCKQALNNLTEIEAVS